MSFKELAAAKVARKSQPFTVKLPDGKELTFTANEISFLQRVELGLNSRVEGSDMHTGLIVLSITDSEGNHMTLEQAAGLSNEHQEVFYRAALDVNALGESVKKKAK